MASPIKMNADTPRNAKRSAKKMRKGQLRINPSAAKAFNKEMKEQVKLGKPGSNIKTTSSGFRAANTNSPRKPSVAKVALKGAKNKMKAQGAKINSAPTSRLSQGRRGK
jgi:hypothetical protein